MMHCDLGVELCATPFCVWVLVTGMLENASSFFLTHYFFLLRGHSDAQRNNRKCGPPGVQHLMRLLEKIA